MPMPNSGDPNALLAVNWDDLSAGSQGQCYYYSNISANTFIVAWLNWTYYQNPSQLVSFEIIIDGNNNDILMQYLGDTFVNNMTVGIENREGNDGLLVAFNEPYLHDNLAIRFTPPNRWLNTDLESGVLSPTDPPLWFNITMDGSLLEPGLHNGAIVINSNDPLGTANAIINIEYTVEAVCDFYIPGDVNGSNSANGIDVVFLVAYFKGGDPPYFECPVCTTYGGPAMRYASGDVNGSCSFNGLDVTYYVNYLKGIGPGLTFCGPCAPYGRLLSKKVDLIENKNDDLNENITKRKDF